MIELALPVSPISAKGALAPPPARTAAGDFQTALSAAAGPPGPARTDTTPKSAPDAAKPTGDASLLTETLSSPAPALPPSVVPVDATVTADLGDALIAPLPGRPGLPGKRQPLADDGKTASADAPDEDPARDLIWLPAGMMPPSQPPAARPAVPLTGTPIAPSAGIAPARAGVDPATVAPDRPSGEIAPVTDIPASMIQPGTASPAPVSPGLAGVLAPTGAPVRIDGAVTLAAAPRAGALQAALAPATPLGNPTQSIAQPAGQVFAAAIASAVQARAPAPSSPTATAPASVQSAPPQEGGGRAAFDARAPQPVAATPAAAAPTLAGISAALRMPASARAPRDDRDPADARTPVTVASLEALATPAIAAPALADTGHPALDLSRDSGLQGMIDRIEMLRDDADARDTRIRLVPDALGAVDVSVRKDGERVHVHFDTENEASARLIGDAQPRLADLAEARGVRLGQTTVDSGASDRRQPHPSAPNPTAAPVPAAAPTGAEADTITDIRLA